MSLNDLIAPEAVLPSLKATSKKQVIEILSQKAAELTGEPQREIFDTLLQRERLGSTGVGSGVAIPHGKMSSLNKIYGVFARLETSIDFDAIDDKQVDIIFLLLAPEGAGADHLKALAKISRAFRNPEILKKIRATSERDSLYAILVEPPVSSAA